MKTYSSGREYNDWGEIAYMMGGTRTASQCCTHHLNIHDYNMSRIDFTEEEVLYYITVVLFILYLS